jgi:hypothetical protein
MRLGDLVFERVDVRGAFRSIRNTREAEDSGDVRAILRLQLDVLRFLAQVVLAIGEAEAALEEIADVASRTIEIGGDPEPEKTVGVEVRGVERIDVGAQLAAENARER